MAVKDDLRQLLKPYYLFNLLMSISYIALKKIPGICSYLFHSDSCEFEGRESEILFFLLIVVMIRTRKSGSLSMINYLSSSFIYTKVANLLLWFYADFIMGIVYGIIFIMGALIFPEPTYSGRPDNVLYFLGLQGLEEELAKRDATWLVTFYTVWSPTCTSYAPVFSKLSNDYGLDNFKFGKVDVGRYPDAAKKYRINEGALSKQLPTTILFKDGKEVTRRPILDSKGNTSKFFFSAEHIKNVFDLNNLYEQCKNRRHLKSD